MIFNKSCVRETMQLNTQYLDDGYKDLIEEEPPISINL